MLDRGETPSTPSFIPSRTEVAIVSANAGSGNDPILSFDTYENTHWASAAKIDSAWVTYTLCENTKIDEICMKMKDFRTTSYPIEVYAGDSLVWKGNTPKSLSFIHIPLTNAPASDRYTICLAGATSVKDAFGAVREMDSRNDEKKSRGGKSLRIIEIEFLKDIR